MRMPEMDEPVTRGRVVIDRGAEDKRGRPANALHAFSKGATFGLIVAGQILYEVWSVSRWHLTVETQDECVDRPRPGLYH